jgi:hypothetical protein
VTNDPEMLMRTVGEARLIVMAGQETKDGIICPVCDQKSKIYLRRIHRPIAIMMIMMYRLTGPLFGYLHTNVLAMKCVQAGFRINTQGGDFVKLVYWGLIAKPSRPAIKTATKDEGFWRLTPEGVAFVTRKLSVPRLALVRDGKFLGFRGDEVTIEACLKEPFLYDKVMMAANAVEL